MAYINSVFGFRPVKQVGAGYNAAASNEYTIANNETNAIPHVQSQTHCFGFDLSLTKMQILIKMSS